MVGISIRRFDDAAYSAYTQWFTDQDTAHWVQPPTQQWFAYVSDTDGVYAWVIYKEDELIGVVQIDRTEAGTGAICIVVNGRYRRQGLGRLILASILDQLEVKDLRKINAEIAPENLASLRCFSAAGFVQGRAGPNEDGMLVFVYKR